MQKHLHWSCALFGFLVLYGVTFHGVIVLPYALHDDFNMWSYNPRSNFFGHNLHNFMAFLGRPLAGFLLCFQSYFIYTLQDVSYLRLTSVFLCALSSTGLFYWFSRHGVDAGLSFLASAGIFFAPGLQASIIWSTSVPIVLTVFTSILAGLVLLPIKPSLEVSSVLADKSNRRFIYLSIALLIVGLYTYASSVMIFLIFPLAGVLIAPCEEFYQTLKRVVVEIGIFVTSCLIYFVSYRLIIQPFYFHRFPRAEADMAKLPEYQFKLLSYSQIPDKISLLFKQLLPNALDIFNYDFELSWTAIYCVLFVIVAGVVAFFSLGQRQHKSSGENGRLFSTLFFGVGFVSILFLMANAPGLLPQGTHANSARIYISNTAIIFLILSWSVFHLAGLFHQYSQITLSRIILGVIVAALCFVAQHNTLRSAYLLSTELKYIESQVASHLRENPQFHIIRARWTKDDIYTPTSFYWMDIPWIIRSIYVKYGQEAKFNPSKISSGTAIDPYEKASNKVIVDVNPVTDTFYNPPVGFPPVSLIRKDYYKFDIINVKNPTANDQYFAVSAGEYDVDKKACPPGGCTRVFAGPTLEAVTEWIDNVGGGDMEVVSSSQLNEFFGATNLMIDSSPIWHSQSPAKYPEWIQINFKTEKTVSGFGIQSQPDASNREPVYLRAPRDFVFQSSEDGQQWNDICNVQGAMFTRGEEWMEWECKNKIPYKHYRFYITANSVPTNSGRPNLVTIYHLKLKISQ